MATEKAPTTIKKYANRRLYHTGTSTYVTLEDLSRMVRAGDDFVVYDAKTGEDITRSVLGQIIFEQENKEGQNLLPVAFLRQLIRFYGDSLQALVPRYLEFSMEHLTRDQEKLREQMSKTFGPAAFHAVEDQVRANMAFFTEAMRLFSPFAGQAAAKPQGRDEGEAPGEGQSSGADPAPGEGKSEARPEDRASASELEALKRQMSEMAAKLDALSRK